MTAAAVDADVKHAIETRRVRSIRDVELMSDADRAACNLTIEQWKQLIQILAEKCAICAKVTSKLCGKCRLVRYCSEACQLQHWKAGHKTACVNIATVTGAAAAKVENPVMSLVVWLLARKKKVLHAIHQFGVEHALGKPVVVLVDWCSKLGKVTMTGIGVSGGSALLMRAGCMPGVAMDAAEAGRQVAEEKLNTFVAVFRYHRKSTSDSKRTERVEVPIPMPVVAKTLKPFAADPSPTPDAVEALWREFLVRYADATLGTAAAK